MSDRLPDPSRDPRSPKQITYKDHSFSAWITAILIIGQDAPMQHLPPGPGPDGGEAAGH